jgi:hypothetical protein
VVSWKRCGQCLSPSWSQLAKSPGQEELMARSSFHMQVKYRLGTTIAGSTRYQQTSCAYWHDLEQYRAAGTHMQHIFVPSSVAAAKVHCSRLPSTGLRGMALSRLQFKPSICCRYAGACCFHAESGPLVPLSHNQSACAP